MLNCFIFFLRYCFINNDVVNYGLLATFYRIRYYRGIFFEKEKLHSLAKVVYLSN